MIVVAMFGFGYALVPLYEAICEITGINILARKEGGNADWVKNTQVDESRSVEIIFDANERGDWTFKPEVNRLKVHPGQLTTVKYTITNQLPKAAEGQAIPSYLPAKAAQHFAKLECFCFKQQPFKSGEQRDFPVVFVVNPKLPADVHTITLSYTFFEVPGATAQLQSSSGTELGAVAEVTRVGL